MALSRILPVTLGLALSGALIGVYAGRSALGEIPAFYAGYSTSYSSFRDLVPGATGPTDDGAGLGMAIADCTACDDVGSGQYPWLSHAVFTDAQLGIAEDHGPIETEELAFVEYQEPEIEGAETASAISRYSTYPVTEEEAVQDAEAQKAPAVVVTAAACDATNCVPVGM